MKPNPSLSTAMKTTDITRYFRNDTTPTARLARWQNRHATSRGALAFLRSLPSYAGETLAERRTYALSYRDQGPELSAPEADLDALWIDDVKTSPLVTNYWQGRTFLSHQGWYTSEDCHETLEAYAVQLAAFPGLIFEAMHDSSGGSTRVILNWNHAPNFNAHGRYPEDAREEAAREAIRSADSTTRRQAEEERDFLEKEDRKQEAEENRQALAYNRQNIRSLIRDLRQLCKTSLPNDYPEAARAVRLHLRGLLNNRNELMTAIRELTA